MAQQDIDFAQNAASVGPARHPNAGHDAALKAFARTQLPGLRNHLERAQDLQAKLQTSTSLR